MCSKGISKCLLVLFNVGFLLLGGLSLAMGIFVLMDKEQILSVMSRVPFGGEQLQDVLDKSSLLESSAYVLIVAGGIVFVIAFLGFCGAVKNKPAFLYGYAACVIVILLLEIAAGVMGYLYYDNLNKNLKGFLDTTLKKYYKGADFKNGNIDAITEAGKPISVAWDFAQYYFQCCGRKDYTDYQTINLQLWNNTYEFEDDGVSYVIEGLVPVTCCKIDEKKTKFPSKFEFEDVVDCLENANSTSTNHKGCFKELKSLYTRYTMIIGGIGVGIAVIEIIGVIAACCLVRQIKKEKQNKA